MYFVRSTVNLTSIKTPFDIERGGRSNSEWNTHSVDHSMKGTADGGRLTIRYVRPGCMFGLLIGAGGELDHTV